MNLRLVPPWLRAAPILLGLVVVLGGSTVFSPAPVAVVRPSLGFMPESNGVRAQHAPPKPVLPPGAIGRLTIAAIRVDAVARPVGLSSSGAMDTTPNIWEVGVFDQSVMPGQNGGALIEGHLDWTTGPAVFWDLHKLGNGDEIDYTSADGTTYRFGVSKVRNVPYNSQIPEDISTRTGTPMITLITCSGSWIGSAHSYSTRLLLTATEI